MIINEMNFSEALSLVTQTLGKVKRKKSLAVVLGDLLTPAEIMDIADRITVLTMLKKGKSQREIADTMGISVTTVSRGNRVLKYGNGEIEKYV